MSDSNREWGQNTDAAIKQRNKEMSETRDHYEAEGKELSAANPYPQAIKEMSSRLAKIGYLEGVIDSHVADPNVSATCKEYLKEMVALITKG